MRVAPPKQGILNNVFVVFQEKAENFVMAALFCASEEGNVDGLKDLSETANNIDLNTANKVMSYFVAVFISIQ